MRDGTTSHVSGSDSADEKGVLVERFNAGNISILYPSIISLYGGEYDDHG